MTITNTEAVSDADELIRVVFKAMHGHDAPANIEPPFHAHSPLGRAVSVAEAVSLSRRAANSVGGVEVKALPWFVNGVTSIWTGELLFGVYYTIVDESNGWRVFRHQFRSEASETEVAYVASLEQAKAAAQADFNQRILSAIEPLQFMQQLPAVEAEPVAWLLTRETEGMHEELVSLFAITDGDRSLGWKDTPLYTHRSSPVSAEVTEAARDVLAERQRQVEAEGWTPKHDDEHQRGEMAGAAACYALRNVQHWGAAQAAASLWPWDEKWWKPSDNRRNLVKAGALIIAEIERLDRLAALNGKE